MFRHNNFRRIISFCLVICMSMMCAIHVSANSSSNLTSNNIGVDVFLNTADKIENESNGIRYTFNSLHSTVFKTIDKNDNTILYIEEEGKSDIIKIDKDGNMFLNDNIVNIYYEDSPTENQAGVSPCLTTRYREQDHPAFGKESDYTIYISSSENANVALGERIISMSVTAFGAIMAKECPWVSVLTTVLSEAKAWYDTLSPDATYLSYKVKRYYNKNYPSGWNLDTFCEKIEFTWYAHKNFAGDTLKETTYRVGHQW